MNMDNNVVTEVGEGVYKGSGKNTIKYAKNKNKCGKWSWTER